MPGNRVLWAAWFADRTWWLLPVSIWCVRCLRYWAYVIVPSLHARTRWPTRGCVLERNPHTCVQRDAGGPEWQVSAAFKLLKLIHPGSSLASESISTRKFFVTVLTMKASRQRCVGLLHPTAWRSAYQSALTTWFQSQPSHEATSNRGTCLLVIASTIILDFNLTALGYGEISTNDCLLRHLLFCLFIIFIIFSLKLQALNLLFIYHLSTYFWSKPSGSNMWPLPVKLHNPFWIQYKFDIP